MEDANPQAPVRAGAVDTHCHLFLIEDEPRRVVEAAGAAGVRALICVGIDPDSSRRSAELAEAFRGVFATAGMHPHTASELDARAGARIEELLANPQVVGVGETGLDFYRMRSPREDQERALRAHCALSRETAKPLVVHVRDAWPAVLRVLDEERVDRAVLHCFSGDAALARECAARGYFVSFAGPVSYPGNAHLREAAAAIPGAHVLVETDSPFLPPQSLRGRDNTPANVRLVLEAVARARGEQPGVVLASTADNAARAFGGLLWRSRGPGPGLS